MSYDFFLVISPELKLQEKLIATQEHKREQHLLLTEAACLKVISQ